MKERLGSIYSAERVVVMDESLILMDINEEDAKGNRGMKMMQI